MKIMLKRDQAYEAIRRRIATGELASGDKLPRGVFLADALGVSHITLRAALKRLQKEGLIDIIHGRGTFVGNHPDHVVFKTIGLILPSLGRTLSPEQSPVHFNLISQIMYQAEIRHFEIRTLHRGRRNFDSAAFRNVGVDAIVVIFPHSSDAGMLTELRALGIPLLGFNLFNTELARWHHCLNVDYTRIAADSVSLLHDRGCRKIAFLTYYDLQTDLHPGLLLGGYLSRMNALGLSPTIIQAAALPYGSVKAAEAERLIRPHSSKLFNSDAVITAAATDALATLHLFQEKGIRLPQDKAIISCMDGQTTESAGLTAWRVGWQKAAQKIASRLDHLMHRPTAPPETILINGELISRQTA